MSNVPALVDQFNRPIEKAAVPPVSFTPGDGWFPIVREPFSGAWQRNLESRPDSVLSNLTVFRCISLIAGDIATCEYRLIEQVLPGVWEETESPAFSPVLYEPNHFQNPTQFMERWVISRLTHGNAYILLRRDLRGAVIEMYVLNPNRVKVLVADNQEVFYELSSDNLAGVEDRVTVPGSEIIHDRWNTFYHDLVGLSPIHANYLSASLGNHIEKHSSQFFGNAANPGGFLTAPGRINNETAERLKAVFKEKFTGVNAGSLAVLGDGLTYAPIGVTALDSQLIEQLRWTAEMVAASFGVPGHRAGIAQPPATSVEALNLQYYNCLRVHIEHIERALSYGLRLPKKYWVEFNVDLLLRMDTESQMKAIHEGILAGVLKPDDGRLKLGYGPVPGGDTPYLQKQNYSLAALAKRDALDDPFNEGSAATPQPPPTNNQEGTDAAARNLANLILRSSRAPRLAA